MRAKELLELVATGKVSEEAMVSLHMESRGWPFALVMCAFLVTACIVACYALWRM